MQAALGNVRCTVADLGVEVIADARGGLRAFRHEIDDGATSSSARGRAPAPKVESRGPEGSIDGKVEPHEERHHGARLQVISPLPGPTREIVGRHELLPHRGVPGAFLHLLLGAEEAREVSSRFSARLSHWR